MIFSGIAGGFVLDRRDGFEHRAGRRPYRRRLRYERTNNFRLDDTTLHCKVTSLEQLAVELQHALSQIADIRQQMSRARQFRGFRSATTFMTALAALAAGIWQAKSSLEPTQFIALWVCVAIGCIALCSTELLLRCRYCESEAQSELAKQAIEQFLPFVLVGGLLTGVMWEYAPDAVWILPALWQILFGLGLYSLRRIVPMPIAIVAAFYILCGIVNLSASTHFSPWSMSLPFGVGQMLSALILYWHLERRHAA